MSDSTTEQTIRAKRHHHQDRLEHWRRERRRAALYVQLEGKGTSSKLRECDEKIGAHQLALHDLDDALEGIALVAEDEAQAAQRKERLAKNKCILEAARPAAELAADIQKHIEVAGRSLLELKKLSDAVSASSAMDNADRSHTVFGARSLSVALRNLLALHFQPFLGHSFSNLSFGDSEKGGLFKTQFESGAELAHLHVVEDTDQEAA